MISTLLGFVMVTTGHNFSHKGPANNNESVSTLWRHHNIMMPLAVLANINLCTTLCYFFHHIYVKSHILERPHYFLSIYPWHHRLCTTIDAGRYVIDVMEYIVSLVLKPRRCPADETHRIYGQRCFVLNMWRKCHLKPFKYIISSTIYCSLVLFLYKYVAITHPNFQTYCASLSGRTQNIMIKIKTAYMENSI